MTHAPAGSQFVRTVEFVNHAGDQDGAPRPPSEVLLDGQPVSPHSFPTGVVPSWNWNVRRDPGGAVSVRLVLHRSRVRLLPFSDRDRPVTVIRTDDGHDVRPNVTDESLPFVIAAVGDDQVDAVPVEFFAERIVFGPPTAAPVDAGDTSTANSAPVGDDELDATLDLLYLPDGRFAVVLSGGHTAQLSDAGVAEFDRRAKELGAAGGFAIGMPVTVLGPRPRRL